MKNMFSVAMILTTVATLHSAIASDTTQTPELQPFEISSMAFETPTGRDEFGINEEFIWVLQIKSAAPILSGEIWIVPHETSTRLSLVDFIPGQPTRNAIHPVTQTIQNGTAILRIPIMVRKRAFEGASYLELVHLEVMNTSLQKIEIYLQPQRLRIGEGS